MESEGSPQELENSFLAIFKNPNLVDLAADNGEAMLDLAFQGGVIDAIPVLGSLAKLYRFGIAVLDNRFRRKIWSFLVELQGTTSAQREGFVALLQANDSKLQTAGETLMGMLDRLDHVEKASIIGRLLVAQLEGKLPLTRFKKLAFAVENTFLDDLKLLDTYTEGPNYHPGTTESLYAQGFIFPSIVVNYHGGAKKEGEDQFLKYS
jgi:hypothetical protein